MNFLRKMFGPKDPEVEAQKFIRELNFHSPQVVAIETKIDRLVQQNPLLRFLGGAQQVIGGGAAALQPLDDLRQRLAQAQEREKNVRAQAAVKLGELRHPSVVEPLITALKDKYPLVRSNAAKALGSIGDKKAIQPLTSLAQKDSEKDESVRKVAMQALEIIQKTDS